jgi:hypothetical protein
MDPESSHFLWLQVFVRTSLGVSQKSIRIRRGTTIKELSESLHGTFMRLANQFMGLYLYDEHHQGHWMDQEHETIEYYQLRNMDIIELREKSVFKIGFLDELDGSLFVTCSRDTGVASLLKMIICCISSTVDDPTTVGLCCMKKDDVVLATPFWLEPSELFGNYDFHRHDELFLKNQHGINDSSTISRLYVHLDPVSTEVSSSAKWGCLLSKFRLF